MRTRIDSIAVGLVLLTGTAVGARPAGAQTPSQSSEPAAAAKEGKELHVFRIRGDSPKIDGRLDDEVWQFADAIDDLTQDEPDNMAAPTERTVVQVAYDDRYLYVAAQCFTRDVSQIRTGLGRRDNLPPSDLIYLSFDPRHDHLTAYTFRTNPSGVQGDNTLFDDTRVNNDYDGVWEVQTQITEVGWNAEFRIPFSQMRFTAPPSSQQAVWGFQVRREIQQRGEMDRWIATPRGQQGVVSRFGHLVFDDRLSPPRRIELLPFALSKLEKTTGIASQQAFNAGLDLRVGLGPSATLSATVTPDFGQVEADPAVLNLSVFETFFPEKRPFFLEDSRTFVLQYSQFPDFYSRRIGQTPGRLALKSGDRLIRKPDETTILGAAKVSGKSSGGWTYGGLAALTSREYATVEATTTNAGGEQVVSRAERLIEPMTMYSVGRLQRDIWRGSSNVGLIGTAVVREKDLDAFVGGVDHALRWSRNRYFLNGHWVGTRAPISGAMRTGFGGATNFSYSGKYLGVGGHFDHFGRNFRNTDLGFITSRSNKNDLNASISLGQPDPWKMFRNVGVYFSATRQWTGDDLVIGRSTNAGMWASFRNFWYTEFGHFHNFRRLDDLDTRGGPPIQRPAGDGVYFYLNSDSRKRWGLSVNVNGGRDESGAWNGSVGPNLRMQPSARLQASVGTSYTFAQDVAQWFRNQDADGDGVTDHLYGRLRRDVVNITGRATYAFSRDMTLEAYLQPFVAAGNYTDIRKLARANSFEFTPVAVSTNPDFNRKSLRGTIVMRWEYVRGSSLFVVWNLGISDTSRPGVFSPFRDLGDAFGGSGTNAVAVKVNYWFTP